MGGQRRNLSASFKAKMALDAVRESEAANELAGLHHVHPSPTSAGQGGRHVKATHETLSAQLTPPASKLGRIGKCRDIIFQFFA